MVDIGALIGEIGSRLGRRVGRAIALTAVGLVATVAPAHSAENLIISYGFLERSIPIADLEAFANGQPLSPQLSAYVEYVGLSRQELATIQTLLTQQAEISHTDVSQFLYTTQGITLLNLLGNVVQTPSRQSGFFAIRSGLILAAADESAGLSIINFLKKYPTPGIRIDLAQGLEIAGTVTATLDDAERAFNLVRALAAESAQLSPASDVAETRQLVFGLPQYAVAQQLVRLPKRNVEATLFLPKPRLPNQALPDEIPVVVISHGLGDGRTSYTYLAEYLAEQGFAVASIDHPGSNGEQISQLLSGLSPELIDDREFANRPIDVSELLDELERFAQGRADLRDRLNTKNVGVIGHSFGGYTALALGGATFDSATLAAACEPQPDYLNPSLLLQCQATEIAAESPDLKDDRVQAILAVNPVGRDIFGPSGFSNIALPTMIFSSTADTVAPALPEQIEPFTWLQTPHRYLVLASDSTHFSVIDWNSDSQPLLPVPVALLGDSPELARNYLQVLAFAFMRRHLEQDTRYDAVLTAQFIEESVVRSPLAPLSLIDNLRPEALEQAINGEEVISDRGQRRPSSTLVRLREGAD